MRDNLDLSCAEFGRALSAIEGVDEKILQDSLSVLEEQGLYAFFLYLEARAKQPKVMEKCYQLLQKFFPSASTDDVFDAVLKLSLSIDNLIFARELLVQTLVYARYHSKAKKPKGNKT